MQFRLIFLLMILLIAGCKSTDSPKREVNGPKTADIPLQTIKKTTLFTRMNDPETRPLISARNGVEVEQYRHNPSGQLLNKIVLTDQALFDVAKYDIRPEIQEVLNEALALYQRDYAGQEIVVVGHTDSDGAETYNLKLSLLRARSVAYQLAKMGLDPQRLSIIPSGESFPKQPNNSKRNKAKNRRVELLTSNSRAISLDFVRQLDCGKPDCPQVELSLIGLNRELKLAHKKNSLGVPEQIKTFSKAKEGRAVQDSTRIRNIQAQLIVRDLTVQTQIRPKILLNSRYTADKKDKKRQLAARELR